MAAISGPVCLVISHYNAWDTGRLIRLLDQIASIPAGWAHTTRVVVNQAEDKPLVLPARFAEISVEYRENTGYNIGAWEHGWRSQPFDHFLFLQEECEIAQPGWLRAFVQAGAKHKVGLVGEVINFWDMTWEELDVFARSFRPEGIDVGGVLMSYVEGMKTLIARHGVDPGTQAEHVQSLVMYATRQVLEQIDGFRLGIDKDEAIAAEVAISKGVESVGYSIRQVGVRPFRYIRHPQWSEEEEFRRLRWVFKRFATQYRVIRALLRHRRSFRGRLLA